jgi:hypothetical protein
VLLGRNASPKALALLQTMLLDPATDVEDRTDTVHTALLPVRTDEDVLEMSARLLDHKLPVALEIALIETLLDDPRVEWFGKVGTRPQPRPWTEASAEALRLALALADKIRRRRRLPKDLRSRVAHTATSIRAALEAK